MTDKIQLIKQEIEKLIQEVELGNSGFNESYKQGLMAAYQTIKALIDSIQEEPVSEDLEEEITRCYKSRNNLMMTRKQFGELIHHFTNWQHGKDFDDLLQSEMKFPKEYYEKGRADMKKEMMKDAVDAEVFIDYNINFGYGSLTADIDLDEQHLKEGDKVKIIICKPEQQ